MAVYGQGFYGLDKYGAANGVDFKVDPVSATPFGYNAIHVTWTSPSGQWDSLRLLQSRTGWAADETDGTVLIDTSSATSEYFDNDLLDGTWYYYTLFIEVAGTWTPVGTASALSVGNTGMTDIVWDKIPRWFHYQPTDPTATVQVWEPTAEIVDPNGPWQENQTLKDFLGVLGWGLDYIRTYQSTLLWANDTRQAHLANVYRLAQTLGEEWEPRVPAYLMRQKVQNAGVLAQSRGTLTGLRELISTSVGYDVDLAVGPNMFLNADQAGFENPQYPEWDPAVNYATGSGTFGVPDLVTFNGNVWKCITGAYGQAEAPPATGTSNTWWTKISGTSTSAMGTDLLYDGETHAIVTWKAWVGSVNKALSVAYGVSDPLDQLGNASNALLLRNQEVGATTFTVVGAANPASADAPVPNPIAAVTQGIPLPRVVNWDPAIRYNDGDFVSYGGVAYEARQSSVDSAPATNPGDWKKIGYDNRLPFKFSFWTHAAYDGSPTVPATANVSFFDGQGNPIGGPVLPSFSPLLDSFNTSLYEALPDRSFDLNPGTVSWGTLSGTWVAVPDEDTGVAWSQGAPGLVLLANAPAHTAYSVAVTFGTAPLSGGQSLILSASAETPVPNSYLAVERTRIAQYVGGVVTASSALSRPIADGDRVRVDIDSTAGTATVFLNSDTVAAATLSFTITHFNRSGMKIG